MRGRRPRRDCQFESSLVFQTNNPARREHGTGLSFIEDTDGCRDSNSLQRGQALIRRTGIDQMRRHKRRWVPSGFAGVGTMTLCSEYADLVSRPPATGDRRGDKSVMSLELGAQGPRRLRLFEHEDRIRRRTDKDTARCTSPDNIFCHA